MTAIDVDGIRSTHESEKELIGVPFPSKVVAELMWERTHCQRGALLAEVERLQRERDEALARWEEAINFYPDLEDLIKVAT